MSHQVSIPAELVSEEYEFDLDNEVVLFGTGLQPGMVVVLEFPFFRRNPSRVSTVQHTPASNQEIAETARWCRIISVEITPIGVALQNDAVAFCAVYADGMMFDRRYATTLGWYVKKASISIS